MKKLILSVAIVAATMSGFTAAAKDAKTDKATATEQKCDGKKCDGREANRPCPFEGLNLTDTQKEQIKQLRADKKDKATQKQAQKQTKKQAKREARQQERREELAKIKAILTPEQYVTYLENLVVNKKAGKPGKAGQHAHQAKAGKGMRHAPGQQMAPRGDREQMKQMKPMKAKADKMKESTREQK